MHTTRFALIACLVGMLTACSTTPRVRQGVSSGLPVEAMTRIAQFSSHQKVGEPYTVSGRRYVPQRRDDYDEVGTGSWYGPNFHGRPTANGEVFDQDQLTAAHTTLPIPSVVEVTNLDNGRSIILRLNDRGPFVDDRIIDLSRAAAMQLGYQSRGLARVRVRYLGPAIAANANPRSGSPSPRAGDAPNIPLASAVLAAPALAAPVLAGATALTPAALGTPQDGLLPETGLSAHDPLNAGLEALPPPAGAAHPAPGTFDPAPLDADLPAISRSAPAQPIPGEDALFVAPPTAPLTVQVGAFSTEANARALADRLQAAGDVWLETRPGQNGSVYRVYFGHWTDSASADSARTLLENWDVFDSIVVDTPR